MHLPGPPCTYQVHRCAEHAAARATGRELPLNATPIKFASWMGGDRDGNPNVTAKVTAHVVALSRWMAADLYLKEVEILRFEVGGARGAAGAAFGAGGLC